MTKTEDVELRVGQVWVSQNGNTKRLLRRKHKGGWDINECQDHGWADSSRNGAVSETEMQAFAKSGRLIETRKKGAR